RNRTGRATEPSQSDYCVRFVLVHEVLRLLKAQRPKVKIVVRDGERRLGFAESGSKRNRLAAQQEAAFVRGTQSEAGHFIPFNLIVIKHIQENVVLSKVICAPDRFGGISINCIIPTLPI